MIKSLVFAFTSTTLAIALTAAPTAHAEESAAAPAKPEPAAAPAKPEPAAAPAKPEPAAAPAKPESAARAEVKAATGIENRMPTGEGTTFQKGTLIYVWSQVTGANGQQVEHVWKRDGKEFRRAKFSIGSKRWSMNSRMPGAAKGSYVVEVVLGEEKLGEVSFVVE